MVRWVNDPDFGWYDADDPLGNVPSGPTVIAGTQLAMDPNMVNAALSNLDLRNVGGTYHPDVVMPDPVITTENIQRGYMPTAVNQNTAIFLNALNALATGRDASVPAGTPVLPTITPTPVVTPDPTPTPTPALSDADVRARGWEQLYGAPGSAMAFNSFSNLNRQQLTALLANPDFALLYPSAKEILDARPPLQSTTGQVPWDTMPNNSLEQLVGKMNQGFYTTDTSGHYNSLTTFYNDAEAFLRSQDMDPTDQEIYDAMALIAQGAATAAGSTVGDEYFWYDRNIESWRNEGRPVRPGGPATAPIPSATPEIQTGDTTVTSTDASGNILDPMFNVDTTSVPAGFTAEEWNGLTDEQRTDFRTQFGDGVTTTATPAETPFTGSTADAGVGGPSTMDIFGQMQTQENFPADVFRRFLAEQVSPSGAPRALSPFMMRGAQDLAPQLMSEYNASMYNPSNWTDAGNQTTFGDWLRAGERPTRQGMFNTLQDIGSVISGGQQGITAPGLSLGESLRRQNIFDQFGTETADSRKALQGLFSSAALSGVAPAFRYPVQSAAQNLFQTQRALQPEQSFLSFLGERL